jgi:hypothetical protein
MAELDFRLLNRRIDVLEARIRPLEDQLKPRMRKTDRSNLMKQIMSLHQEQMACIRRIGQLTGSVLAYVDDFSAHGDFLASFQGAGAHNS